MLVRTIIVLAITWVLFFVQYKTGLLTHYAGAGVDHISSAIQKYWITAGIIIFMLVLGVGLSIEISDEVSQVEPAKKSRARVISKKQKRSSDQARSQLDPTDPFTLPNVANSLGIDGGIFGSSGGFGKFP